MVQRSVVGLTCALCWVSALGCGGDVATGGGGEGATATGAGGDGATTTGTGGSAGGSTTSTSTSTATSSGCNDCFGFDCCDNTCVNLANDIHNCGACGTTCPGPNPYCAGGVCGAPTCTGGPPCVPGNFCCAGDCCTPGQLCCTIPGPIGDTTSCVAPTPQGTCPTGCVTCQCTSPDTPIATPGGERPIASLEPGELVYSSDGLALLAVPIARTARVAVRDHEVVRVSLANGAVLEISPGHPTADGRTFAELSPGRELDGVAVVAVETIGYAHTFTYDILPASDTGTYVAGGVLVGSTLHGKSGRAP